MSSRGIVYHWCTFTQFLHNWSATALKTIAVTVAVIAAGVCVNSVCNCLCPPPYRAALTVTSAGPIFHTR